MAKSKAPVSNAASAADLLGQLSDLAPATEKPKAGAKQRWIVELQAGEQELLNRWITAKSVSEVIDARLENSKDDLAEYAMNLVAEALWKTKTKPLNPTLTIKKAGGVDSQAVFLFSDKFKYRFPDVPDGVKPRDHFIKVFVDLGIGLGEATKLVDQELDLNPVVGIRPLTELTQGHYGEKRQFFEATAEEKEAGRKLMAFLVAQATPGENVEVEPLTPAERALIIKRDPGIKVKSGFLGRICNYAHSVDQLKAIFKVIVPIAYPAHQKFAINDTPESRANRLKDAVGDIIGVKFETKADKDE